ncbi:MAG: hypothetical protein ABFD08_01610 [Syntrophomonas sp.]
MAKVLRRIKILTIIIFTLLLISGGAYLLMYLNFFQTPALLVHIPVLGTKISQSTDKVSVVKYQKIVEQNEQISKENEKLKKTIEIKKSEMEDTQSSLSDVKKKLKLTEQSDDNLKEEVARLNKEIIDLKTQQGSKSAAFKDMAQYFSQMKAKDAADIMSRLSDEDIIGILSEMESEVVAELLQNMDRDKAAGISKKMLVATP